MIRVEQLTRRYDDVVALDGIDFGVEPGEVLGFLGPNGAGKTTTMKILTGFLAPTSGIATIGGLPVDGRDGDFRHLVGYLPETAPSYPEMRVRDYVDFVARLRGVPSRRQAVERALERCGLGAMARREIRALSKGYRQRVGLAQAIVHDPPVLILDEPTSGLDPNQVMDIRRLIRDFGAEHTVVFSSHVMGEVRAVADRVIILDRGRIVADDRLDALAGEATRVRAGGVEPARLADALGALPEVEVATVDGDGVRLTGPAPDALRAAVARHVVGAGWALHALEAEQVDLEAIFRRATVGGDARPRGGDTP